MIHNTNYKIVFFGSSLFCLPVLEAINANFKLMAIVTKPDKKIGRKQIISPSPPKQFALSHNIETLSPGNKEELLNLSPQLENLSPDLFIVADYGMIIPEIIFSLPRYKTINIHFSRLPEYRGPSPVQYTILNGDKSAWISYMLMAKQLDTGDLIKQFDIPLKGDETTKQLYTDLFDKAADKLLQVINNYISGQMKPAPQDHTKAVHTKRLTKDDGFLPFDLLTNAINGDRPGQKQFNKWPLSKILPANLCTINFALSTERAVRALSPWPGVWTEIRIKNHESGIMKKRLRILKTHIELITNNSQPITKLVLDLVQLEGKKPVSWKQFRQGYPEIL